MVGRDLTSRWWFFSTRQQPSRSLNCSTFIWLCCTKLFYTCLALALALILLPYYHASAFFCYTLAHLPWYPRCIVAAYGFWLITASAAVFPNVCDFLRAGPSTLSQFLVFFAAWGCQHSLIISSSSVSFLLPLFHIFLLFWYSSSSVILEFPSPGTFKACPDKTLSNLVQDDTGSDPRPSRVPSTLTSLWLS